MSNYTSNVSKCTRNGGLRCEIYAKDRGDKAQQVKVVGCWNKDGEWLPLSKAQFTFENREELVKFIVSVNDLLKMADETKAWDKPKAEAATVDADLAKTMYEKMVSAGVSPEVATNITGYAPKASKPAKKDVELELENLILKKLNSGAALSKTEKAKLAKILGKK